MRFTEKNSQYTTLVHSMVKHKIQATLWDLLSWLDSKEDLQSVRDLLSYIRLFTDFGDNTQGRVFYDLIHDNKTLRLILPEIAARLVSRGKATGTTWLEDLGKRIQELHKIEPHPGLSQERENAAYD